MSSTSKPTLSDLHQVIADAGFAPLWQDWCEANPMLLRNPVAIRAQMQQFADWIGMDHGRELHEHAERVITSGSYRHPFLALKARMKVAVDTKAIRARLIAEREAEERAYTATPVCQPGERRQERCGRVWTVESVEYGRVFFRELGAPIDERDSEVATWTLVPPEGK